MKKFIIVSIILLFLSCNSTEPSRNGNISYEPGMPIVEISKEFSMVGRIQSDINIGRFSKMDKIDLLNWVEEQTNIKVNWSLFPNQLWQDKKNSLLASGDLPDVFHGQGSFTVNEVEKLGSNGTILPLSDLIENYAPNIKARLTEEYIQFTKSSDGDIYSLANYEDLGFDSLGASIINIEWLHSLNLETPKTTEELYTVLKAFKTQDPNGNGEADELPLTFLFYEGIDYEEAIKRGPYWLFPAFGIEDNPIHIAISSDDEVIFTATRNEWKETIKYLNRLYSEGLIDPESFSQDRKKATYKVRMQKNIGVYSDYRHKFSMASPEVENIYTLMEPLTGPSGNKGWLRASMEYTSGGFSITKDCLSPETMIKWADFINREEVAIQMANGMFKNKDHITSQALIPSKETVDKWERNRIPSGKKYYDWKLSAPIGTAFTIITKEIQNKFITPSNYTVSKNDTCDFYRPFLSKNPSNYPYRFTTDEYEELKYIEKSILNYVYSTQKEWIINGLNEDTWSSYLYQLESFGLNRYLEIYTAAYNRS